VTGEIPKHLHGLLLRIGSNPIYVKKPTLFEWYLGDGMVHGLKLKNGEAIWFKSKMIATDIVQKNKKKQSIQGYRRGAHDVVNTNIFKHAGKLWAVIEAGAFPICLDYELNAERYQLLIVMRICRLPHILVRIRKRGTYMRFVTMLLIVKMPITK
jgi:carotenoid cleavage dioxygenase